MSNGPGVRSYDELSAETTERVALQFGIYIECAHVTDPETGQPAYYAMSMPTELHDDRLLWDDFKQQPTFVEGYSSRRAALEATCQKYQAVYLGIED